MGYYWISLPELLKSILLPMATRFYILPHSEYINSCTYALKDICIEDIPVVREYADVFSDDLPVMPPDQDIEFVIELQPGTAPILAVPNAA